LLQGAGQKTKTADREEKLERAQEQSVEKSVDSAIIGKTKQREKLLCIQLAESIGRYFSALRKIFPQMK
jgi:hypothetical protein